MPTKRVASAPSCHSVAATDTSQDISFEVAYVRALPEALSKAQGALVRHRERFRGPMVAVCQAAERSADMRRFMPVLGDLPCVDLPFRRADSQGLPSLFWQASAARTALLRVAQVPCNPAERCGIWNLVTSEQRFGEKSTEVCPIRRYGRDSAWRGP